MLKIAYEILKQLNDFNFFVYTNLWVRQVTVYNFSASYDTSCSEGKHCSSTWLDNDQQIVVRQQLNIPIIAYHHVEREKHNWSLWITNYFLSTFWTVFLIRFWTYRSVIRLNLLMYEFSCRMTVLLCFKWATSRQSIFVKNLVFWQIDIYAEFNKLLHCVYLPKARIRSNSNITLQWALFLTKDVAKGVAMGKCILKKQSWDEMPGTALLSSRYLPFLIYFIYVQNRVYHTRMKTKPAHAQKRL